MADIGDVYTDLPTPVFELLNAQGIVKIFGICRIDREGWNASKIATLRHFFLLNPRVQFICGSLHLNGELVR
ncbi:MAG: Uncharacterised protein [Cryomorphaceae bacterium]|nr:MAG: Uncharacterised protein [Cryomorphaceae bacterium]